MKSFLKSMGKNFTPLNVWQELIYAYILSSVSIIMLRLQKSMIIECSLFIIRLIRTINLLPGNQLAKKVQPYFIMKDGLIGQVTIDTQLQPICIPSNSTIAILDHTNKLPPRITCLVEQAEHHNLPLGIVINQSIAIP